MSDNNVIALLFAIFSGVWVIFLALVIFVIIARWKLYKKAGKPGWASIVPVYNTIVLFDIIGYKWYYIFFIFIGIIPIIGMVLSMIFAISYNIKLAKSFGQQPAFGIGLWFLNPIFTAIIAFSNDIKYVGPSVNGDIDLNDLF